jgi:hypothetical protein
MENSDHFEWQVGAAGYTWTQAWADLSPTVRRRQWILGELCPERPGPPTRSYHPLREHTGLFLTFADTPPTREGILEFARRFGRLGKGTPAEQAQLVKDKDGRDARLTEEPWELWRMQISELKQASEVWHLCQVGDMEGLAARIRWEHDEEGQDSVSYISDPDYQAGATTASGHVAAEEPIASRRFHPERLARCRPGDLVRPALIYVQDAINVRLEGLAWPRLAWDAQGSRLGLRLVPETLLGAMWLQFALAVSGGKAFRRCAACGEWFELSPKVGRKDKLFCSGACRTRSHRGRREKACEMHRQGKSLKEIAKEIESDVPTVRKWVADFKA